MLYEDKSKTYSQILHSAFYTLRNTNIVALQAIPNVDLCYLFSPHNEGDVDYMTEQ
jgi:hypothetical protein